MREHMIVTDLGYGDAGKGTIIDWLCAREPIGAVVRFNGGGQAAHNVVLPDGRHHTFAQFGSGTLRGVPTHLSRFMVTDPLSLAREAAHLSELGVPDPFRLLTVDRDALLATPYHVAAGQARELARGDDRHGSCGMGVGETMAYALEHPELAPTVGDCEEPARLTRKLYALREALGVTGPPVEDCVAAYRAFAERVILVGSSFTTALLRRRPVIFEGAQGVLLDEWHGFHPYTTWSTTTFANALELLDGVPAVRLGVLRTYTPRHGPGPLVTEDAALTLPEAHNGNGPWQGSSAPVTSTRWPTATRWRSRAGPTPSRSPTWTRRSRGCACRTTSASCRWARQATSKGRPGLPGGCRLPGRVTPTGSTTGPRRWPRPWGSRCGWGPTGPPPPTRSFSVV